MLNVVSMHTLSIMTLSRIDLTTTINIENSIKASSMIFFYCYAAFNISIECLYAEGR